MTKQLPPPVHVAFTGTQAGMNTFQLQTLKTALGNLLNYTFHHGGCIGADKQAHGVAMKDRARIVVHPPSDFKKYARVTGYDGYFETRPPKPYLVRNHEMVDECTILLAAPRTNQEVLRSGTWATVRYARKQGLAIVMLYPFPDVPICGECNEPMNRFHDTEAGVSGWGCDLCGWTEDDER